MIQRAFPAGLFQRRLQTAATGPELAASASGGLLPVLRPPVLPVLGGVGEPEYVSKPQNNPWSEPGRSWIAACNAEPAVYDSDAAFDQHSKKVLCRRTASGLLTDDGIDQCASLHLGIPNSGGGRPRESACTVCSVSAPAASSTPSAAGSFAFASLRFPAASTASVGASINRAGQPGLKRIEQCQGQRRDRPGRARRRLGRRVRGLLRPAGLAVGGGCRGPALRPDVRDRVLRSTQPEVIRAI